MTTTLPTGSAGSGRGAATPGAAHGDLPGVIADLCARYAGPDARWVTVGMSRNEHPTTVVLCVPSGGREPTAALKVAPSAVAAAALRREATALERLGRCRDAGLTRTLPRLLELREAPDGGLALATTVLPGRPLATAYHQWRHTARPTAVRADFAAADTWLANLAGQRLPVDAPDQSGSPNGRAHLAARWPGIPTAARAEALLEQCQARLGPGPDSHVVHGDFWAGNILTMPGRGVTGVVDWEHARFGGDCLADWVRFALAYTLYLDRHTAPGRAVSGHAGLRAGADGDPVRWLLTQGSWYADVVAAFVGRGLALTGRHPDLWRVALLAGLGEVAATADEPGFAAQHIELVTGLAEVALTGPRGSR